MEEDKIRTTMLIIDNLGNPLVWDKRIGDWIQYGGIAEYIVNAKVKKLIPVFVDEELMPGMKMPASGVLVAFEKPVEVDLTRLPEGLVTIRDDQK